MLRKRLIASRLREAASAVPCLAVVGARQVGKSTVLGQVFPDAVSVVFDPVQDIGNARRDPDLFLASQPRPLILDEIQYAPQLVAAVKRAIDRDRRPGQFLITGSQQWQVMAQLSESLAGRVMILDLEGFSATELADRTDAWLPRWLNRPDEPPLEALSQACPFPEQVWRGFLPEAQVLPISLVPEFHRSYQTTYIERDVRLLANLGDWSTFGRFARLLSALTGQEINRSQVGRELGISPQTATAWISMLVGTCQWHELPPWHGNAIKRLSRRPKGHIADSGQACSSLAIPSPAALVDHPAFGAIVESTVVGEVRRLAAQMSTRPSLYHWRSHAQAEVDLIVSYNGRMHPIEIKASSHPGREAMSGIRAFRQTYPEHASHAALVLAPVERGYQIGEACWVAPWNAA